jgi:predicted dehydrogenase
MLRQSNRVVIGCIGVGNRAQYLLESVLQIKEAQVVAVCDVKNGLSRKSTGHGKQLL